MRKVSLMVLTTSSILENRECRRKPASSLAKADLRPHSSKFSYLLTIPLF
jgi:hypothetical protein